jgi:endonuclease-3 related protein
LYDRLLAEYGPQGWWPAETDFEMLVGAVLTQNTAWTNVERALANLKEAGALNPAALRETDLEHLAAMIRPSGYFNAKARKLQALGEYLARYDDDLDRLFRSKPLPELRKELLAVFGIGPETADSMLLYAGGLPTFVVDAYTLRVLDRMRSGRSLRYETAQRLFHRDKGIDPDRHYAEFHALIVAHGKNTCRARNPGCDRCPVLDMCRTGHRTIRSRNVA